MNNKEIKHIFTKYFDIFIKIEPVELIKILNDIYSNAEILFSENEIKITRKEEIYKFDYTISKNNTEIVINKIAYEIPNWYNKEMIKIKDLKTLQMIFYGILSDEIQNLIIVTNN